MEDEVKPVKRGTQRRENRMAAVQFLYQWELNKPDQLNDALRVFIESQDQERDYYAFAEELIHGTIDHIEAVDEEIKVHADNWTFERLSLIHI